VFAFDRFTHDVAQMPGEVGESVFEPRYLIRQTPRRAQRRVALPGRAGDEADRGDAEQSDHQEAEDQTVARIGADRERPTRFHLCRMIIHPAGIMARNEPSRAGPLPVVVAVTAYAAFVWALLFALSNVYWGLGGRLAVPLADPEVAFGDPAFVVFNWAAVVLKVGLGLLALATVHPWGRVFPRLAMLIVTYAAGGAMLVYGGLGFVLDVLRLLGFLAVPSSGLTSLRWHVFLWDPWWMLGGVLFLAVARIYQRRTSIS